jgi:hypothetical protein
MYVSCVVCQVLDDDSCIESVTSQGGEMGQGPVIRIELLSRHYDIPLVGTTGQLPVSFLLTETLRRYAGIRVRRQGCTDRLLAS